MQKPIPEKLVANPTVKQLAKKIDAINDEAMLTPNDIQEMGVFINANLTPTRYILYKYIRRGKIEAMNLAPSDIKPKYVIRGAELKRFLRERYKLGIKVEA